MQNIYIYIYIIEPSSKYSYIKQTTQSKSNSTIYSRIIERKTAENKNLHMNPIKQLKTVHKSISSLKEQIDKMKTVNQCMNIRLCNLIKKNTPNCKQNIDIKETTNSLRMSKTEQKIRNRHIYNENDMIEVKANLLSPLNRTMRNTDSLLKPSLNYDLDTTLNNTQTHTELCSSISSSKKADDNQKIILKIDMSKEFQTSNLQIENDKIGRNNWEQKYKKEIIKNTQLLLENKQLTENLQAKEEYIINLNKTSIDNLRKELEVIEKSLSEKVSRENGKKITNMVNLYEEETKKQTKTWEEKINQEKEIWEKEKGEFEIRIQNYEDKFKKLRGDRWKIITEKEKISMGAKETLVDFEMKLLCINGELSNNLKETNKMKKELKVTQNINKSVINENNQV